MTVALAILVADGLVMAADSQSTLRHHHLREPHNVTNLYWGAEKLLPILERPAMAVMGYGAGSLGGSSLGFVARELAMRLGGERRKTGDGDRWCFDPARHGVEWVALRLRDLLMEQLKQPRYGAHNSRPSLTLTVCGIDPQSQRPEAWRLEMVEGQCALPQRLSAGLIYGGDGAEAIRRLVEGLGGAGPAALAAALRDGDRARAAERAIAERCHWPLAHPEMPLADAVELARFLLTCAAGFARFINMLGTVGGAHDIAVLDPHRGFQWMAGKALAPPVAEH